MFPTGRPTKLQPVKLIHLNHIDSLQSTQELAENVIKDNSQRIIPLHESTNSMPKSSANNVSNNTNSTTRTPTMMSRVEQNLQRWRAFGVNVNREYNHSAHNSTNSLRSILDASCNKVNRETNMIVERHDACQNTHMSISDCSNGSDSNYNHNNKEQELHRESKQMERKTQRSFLESISFGKEQLNSTCNEKDVASIIADDKDKSNIMEKKQMESYSVVESTNKKNANTQSNNLSYFSGDNNNIHEIDVSTHVINKEGKDTAIFSEKDKSFTNNNNNNNNSNNNKESKEYASNTLREHLREVAKKVAEDMERRKCGAPKANSKKATFALSTFRKKKAIELKKQNEAERAHISEDRKETNRKTKTLQRVHKINNSNENENLININVSRNNEENQEQSSCTKLQTSTKICEKGSCTNEIRDVRECDCKLVNKSTSRSLLEELELSESEIEVRNTTLAAQMETAKQCTSINVLRNVEVNTKEQEQEEEEKEQELLPEIEEQSEEKEQREERSETFEEVVDNKNNKCKSRKRGRQGQKINDAKVHEKKRKNATNKEKKEAAAAATAAADAAQRFLNLQSSFNNNSLSNSKDVATEVSSMARWGNYGQDGVKYIPYEMVEDTEVLYNDIERALHDPDRIQAPPLYVGVMFYNYLPKKHGSLFDNGNMKKCNATMNNYSDNDNDNNDDDDECSSRSVNHDVNNGKNEGGSSLLSKWLKGSNNNNNNNNNNSNNNKNDSSDAAERRKRKTKLSKESLSEDVFTNFSLSASSSGKTHFVQSIDPRYAHKAVKYFVLRWKDKVYVLQNAYSQTEENGFAFIVRVLQELPGVEIITFAAPTLLLPLLCYTAGTLESSCVSDVRLMAWMVHIVDHERSNNNSNNSLEEFMNGCNEDGNSGQNKRKSVKGGVYNNNRSSNNRSNKKRTENEMWLVDGNLYSSNNDNEEKGGGGGEEAKISDYTVLQRICLGREASCFVCHSPLQQLVHEVYYLAPLYRVLYGQLGTHALLQAFLRQEKRISLMLASMKRCGAIIDLSEVHRFKVNCTAQMQSIREEAASYVSSLPDFNIQSHDHCRQAIYEILGLGRYLIDDNGLTASNVSITPGGKLSTAEDTLKQLAKHHPFPQLLLNYRKVAKLLQTYVDGMMSYAIPCTESDALTEMGLTAKQLTNAHLDKTLSHHSHTNEINANTTDLIVNNSSLRDNFNTIQSEEMLELFEDTSLLIDHESSSNKNKNNNSDNNINKESETTPIKSRGRQRSCSCHSSPNNSNNNNNNNTSRSSNKEHRSSQHSKLPTSGLARLHANFLQESTDTGRLSCVEPNLQNLPRTAIMMEEIEENYNRPLSKHTATSNLAEFDFRRCFVAPQGFTLLSVDYQQIELRVLAHLCEDQRLVYAMTHSADIHRGIAQIIFNRTEISEEERNFSKRVVFGVIYGAGPRTIALQTNRSVTEAEQILSMLKTAFPQMEVYRQRVIEYARHDGFVRTISGRLRYLPEINSPSIIKQTTAERQAFNTVVQGSAADVMKRAMLAIEHAVLRNYRHDVYLLTQIHDEVVFAVRKEHIAAVIHGITDAMTHAMSMLVPLTVTAKVGPSLGQL